MQVLTPASVVHVEYMMIFLGLADSRVSLNEEQELNRITEDAYVKNIEKMVLVARARVPGIRLILVTLPPVDEHQLYDRVLPNGMAPRWSTERTRSYVDALKKKHAERKRFCIWDIEAY